MNITREIAIAAGLAMVASLCGMAEASAPRQRVRRVLKYDAPDKSPVWFGGISCASNAAAADYCVLIDVAYADGSHAWDKRAYFSGGTHGWEETSSVFFPSKPVKRIDLHAMLRHGSGRAWFKDVFLKRAAPPSGTVLHEYRRSNRPFSPEDEIVSETFDGKRKAVSFAAAAEEAAPSCPLPPDGIVVWTADFMRCVTPLTFPSGADAAAPHVRLELAGRERESAQMLVSLGPGAALEGVTLDMPVLRGENSVPFRGEVKWERIGYVPRPASSGRQPSTE